MPVVDGVFIPRGELVLAEQTVDYLNLNEHILTRRVLLEKQADAFARRVAIVAAEFQIPSMDAVDALAQTLDQGLRGTVRFGHAQVRKELAQLRELEPVEAAYQMPDAGRYAREARAGLPGILRLIRQRARRASDQISQAALTAAGVATERGLDDVERTTAVLAATARSLHNHALELVGEALNMGRTAAAITLTRPPTFAMRSEQLDKNTCEQCTLLHGAIVEVGSPSFFDYMPPSGCYGGGRCRGVYVFADGISQVRGDEPERRGPQPELPAIPPVRVPERRVA